MTIFRRPARVLSAAAALSFLVLVAGCSDSKGEDNPVLGNGFSTSPSASAAPTASTPATSPAAATPVQLTITVTKGKAEGGLQELSVKKGDKVQLTVTSADTTSEIHVHGYDLKGELAPGKPATISFDATIQGVFEIELEDTSVKIADLTVK